MLLNINTNLTCAINFMKTKQSTRPTDAITAINVNQKQ